MGDSNSLLLGLDTDRSAQWRDGLRTLSVARIRFPRTSCIGPFVRYAKPDCLDSQAIEYLQITCENVFALIHGFKPSRLKLKLN